jgi:hypothetical protein
MSGRLRKRAEVAVAVAVDSRRRHQRDQALGQLKRRQEQLAVPARTGFRAAAGGRSCCLPPTLPSLLKLQAAVQLGAVPCLTYTARLRVVRVRRRR